MNYGGGEIAKVIPHGMARNSTMACFGAHHRTGRSESRLHGVCGEEEVELEGFAKAVFAKTESRASSPHIPRRNDVC